MGKMIYLVRHGADDETIRGGWSDHPLTAEGAAQANYLAEAVDFSISRLYSSDLRRAVQTAEPLSRKLGLPIIPDARFRETNNGVLAGMKHELACAKYPGLYWNTLGWEERYPGGESPKEFYERIASGWAAFQQEVTQEEGNVMLVTHGGVINVILCLIHGLPYTNRKHRWKIPNAEIITLTYKDGKWGTDYDQ